LVQPLEAGVLRCESALRCHVDDEQRLAVVVGQAGRVTLEGLQRNVGESHAGDAIRRVGHAASATTGSRARGKTSATSSTRWTVMSASTASGTSSKSGPLRAGRITS